VLNPWLAKTAKAPRRASSRREADQQDAPAVTLKRRRSPDPGAGAADQPGMLLHPHTRCRVQHSGGGGFAPTLGRRQTQRDARPLLQLVVVFYW
jgi:hypothetical protein